jgi:hypothetical protein
LRATLLAALLLTTQAPSPYAPYAFVQPFAPPPAPATPSPWSAYTPAPVPNADLDDPDHRPSGPAHAELAPGIYHPHASTFQGDGFIPNSTVQGEQQRHYHPAPALNLSVPLE